MATKTVILRPSYYVDASEAISINPSDTTHENSYQLINEEVADDNSTYIILTTGSSNHDPEFYQYGFNCANIQNLSSGIIFFRLAANTYVNYFIYTFDIIDKNNSVIESFEQTVNCSFPDATTFIDFYEIIPTDILQHLNNFDGYIEVKLRPYSNVNGKTVEFKITQSYIELEYKENLDKYYVKHNNTWILLSDVFYKKVNGSWISTEPSILSEELKYLNNYIE